ncbi:bifunctional uroporphyrinogen-III C-methyltransferase/uroporphyrinogen-III synthase [Naumannella sp. ID2617S]|uniref:uroporphyrinogen-III C-methyltransferase n=1 Tax=Enemella dayhoffiae TaxID=2016507 RepID=A0A255H691_9ACTN|nr:uroporphyrinogen-III synthase [Enemella dayhoffiae]NNG20784.1 bifunctional uroporphyrinogen-III C-methyltransferase/uroporphyrinogen-III synthase [Naumannella sp. ID2617S]OYO22796.1 bifunctional uroporphyrinogen-III C-methyltransferase/uroporphyrinogen-III synthase [Enemella dayhoffiae]
MRGRVIFVGTGPGDPDLLTLGAVAAIGEASAVLLDTELMQGLFEHPSVKVAEGVPVSVLPHQPSGKMLPPAQRAKQVLKLAAGGGRVVRLVAGDPFLDGQVADEAAACVRGGIDFEVVPGVSAMTAVPEYAGIPLHNAGGTHFVSTGDRVSKAQSAQWAATGTLVVSTLAGLLSDVVAAVLATGRSETDGCLITFYGGSTEQRTVATPLAGLAEAVTDPQVRQLDPEEPVHLMVGPAVELREDLSWYETKPLFGWRVLVPRTKDQAGPMTNRLRSYGAHSEEVPTISVEPPRSPQQMEKAVRGLVEGRYEWVAFTSVNAVKAVRERLEDYGLDARALSGLKVAAVGKVTAGALQAWGIEPDLVPAGEQSAAGLAAEWPPYDELLDPINRVFLPRADIATETLSAGLATLGWEVEDVTAYRTVRAAPPPAEVREAIKTGRFDAVVFTSSSTVRNLVGIAGKPHAGTVIAVIGPATARTCEEHGLRVDVMAPNPGALELADSLANFAAERRDQLTAAGETVSKPSERKPARRR